jgi:glycosyltransferase involved in cell wall biosynthesis
VRNGGALFREALASVVAQDYANLEIVISDNASTDETPEIIREFQARDRRIVVHRQETLLPVMDNFLYVLHAARGEFFMWAAHDDLHSPDFVSGLLPAFDDPAVALAFPDLVVRGNTREAGFLRQYDFDNTRLAPLQRLRKQVMMQCFHIYGLWRRDFLTSIKWFYTAWWPDMPLMATAAYVRTFRHISGPSFIYLELPKTNRERAERQHNAAARSSVHNVFGLAFACARTAFANVGLLSAVAAFVFVVEKYARIAFQLALDRVFVRT